MRIQLGRLNHWLRKVGLVLTVTRTLSPNDPTPVELIFEKYSSYKARVHASRTH